MNDDDCITLHNKLPTVGIPVYKYDDEVICTSYYSSLMPLENGEILTSIINGRPSVGDPSPLLLNFTTARFIRLRLNRIRTLHADLMSVSGRTSYNTDPLVTRRYFYSIKDISIGGECVCNGHATSCPWNNILKKFICKCEDYTCGDHCEYCCPGFRHSQWHSGSKPCEVCNCHGKADDCYFDKNVAAEKRSLARNGRYYGGGVCINCKQHTAGVNCNTCVEGYFRPREVLEDAENPCQPCNCDSIGALSKVCVRDIHQSEAERGATPGQCTCRKHYTGLRCDRCVPGNGGFPFCRRCSCNPAGIVGHDPCADPCQCKDNVIGRNCDHCKPGFYNLQQQNPHGCLECFCFGITSNCHSESWPVVEVRDMEGWYVKGRLGLAKVSPTWSYHHGNHVLTIQHSETLGILAMPYYWSAPKSYLGNKLAWYGGSLRYIISYHAYRSPTSDVDVILEGANMVLSHTSKEPSRMPSTKQTFDISIVPKNFVDFHTRRRVDRKTLMSVLAGVKHLQIRAVHGTTPRAQSRLHSVSMFIAQANQTGSRITQAVEVCHCPPGYAGISCESCMKGYRRMGGMLYYGVCEPCQCHKHSQECDNLSGSCKSCRNHTTGNHCERCERGYYGDATKGAPNDCRPCPCSHTSSFSPSPLACHMDQHGHPVCDECPPGYAGKHCKRCADGYFRFPTMPGALCQRCDCNGNGDQNNPTACDPWTGKCRVCTGNTAGLRCERCADGFFGDAIVSKNCQPCRCHPKGSLSTSCDAQTGHCTCAPLVTGRQCDKCQKDHYGLEMDAGCAPCSCHPVGALGRDCSEDGWCRCQQGVSGLKCGRCAEGYFGFGPTGCTRCSCSRTNDRCDSNTGQCICPANTEGRHCERCKSRFWSWNQVDGCQACKCSPLHSVHLLCNVTSGQCPCKHRFGGRTCSECDGGFWGHPSCQHCHCNSSGTRADRCSAGLCKCDEWTGMCTCKENVRGKRCDRCREGTFSMSATNDQGCTTCFCSGLTKNCTGAQGLVYTQMKVSSHHRSLMLVDQLNQHEIGKGHYRHLEFIFNVPAFMSRKTMYWKLPKEFIGPKLMSYGGKLRYTIYFEGRQDSGMFSREPEVLLYGSNKKNNVVMHHGAHSHSSGMHIQQSIGFIEKNWSYFNSILNRPVSKSNFMEILAEVKAIVIKASYGTSMEESRISDISLEVAVPYNGGIPTKKASQIEKCDCPAGYTGFSCQDCASGYHRNTSQHYSPWRSYNTCIPCKCNNRSASCDPKTGRCLNCHNNRTGQHCELCSPGFFSRVVGNTDTCVPCACPGEKLNSFSPTCVAEGMYGAYRCDACLLGYEGRHCQKCASGFYGDPRAPGGSCESCACHVEGSMSTSCDRMTGQCTCRRGMSGRACDKCKPLNMLVDNKCVSCDDSCAGVLLSDMDALLGNITSLNFSGSFPAPYERLAQLEDTAATLWEQLMSHKQPVFEIASADKLLADLTKRIAALSNNASQVSQNVHKKEVGVGGAHRLLKEHISTIDRILKQIREIIVEMDSQETNGTLRPDVDEEEMKELERMVEEMRKRDFSEPLQHTEEELTEATRLLKKVSNAFNATREKNKASSLAIIQKLQNVNDDLKLLEGEIIEANDKEMEANMVAENIDVEVNDLEKTFRQFERSLNEANDEVSEANRVVNKAQETVDESSQSITDGRKLGDLLDKATTNMKGLVEDLVKQRLDKKVEETVEKAWNHAISLTHMVDDLISALNRLNNQSHNATDFQNISDIIQLIAAVNKTAMEAQDFASQALNNALGPNGTLREIVEREKDRNVMQRNKLDYLTVVASEIRNQLHDEANHVNKTERQLEGQQQLFQQILEELNRIRNDSMKDLDKAMEDANRINMSASNYLKEAAAFNDTLSNVSKGIQNLEDLNKKNLESINDVRKSVTQLNETLSEAHSQVSLLSSIQTSLRDLNEQAKHNLSDIKDLIKLSRELVNRVQIGININKESCLRTYMPPLNVGKHTYNNLTFQLNVHQLNNSLFFIGQDAKSDYMALEMRDGIVNFMWNLGSGDGEVQYPRLPLNKDTWYLVTISRELNKGSLTVQTIDDLDPPSSKAETRYSPATAIALDITKLSRMFIGGINKSIQLPETLQYFTFDGSIRNVMFNGDYFSAWNFHHMEGVCNGTAVSKQAGSQEEVHFQGDGSFVEVIPKERDLEIHDISFDISTYVANGLLMYVAEEKSDRFVSLQLDNGTITVVYTDKDGTAQRLTSTFNYMKKGFLKIQLLIRQKDIKLIVDRQVNNGGYDGAFKPSNKWYFGGLPKHIIVNLRPEVQHHSYSGCMRGIKILDGQKPRLLQSLNAVGIQSGCQLEKAYRAEVEPGGFVELPKNGMFLGVDTKISFTFSTNSSSALLLYGGSKPWAASDFYLIYLKNHIVEVRIVINGKNTELSQQLDTGQFDNAASHIILLSRNNQKVELSVDEAVPVKGDLSTNQILDVSHVLLGGSLSASDVPVTLNRKYSLCVTGLIINNVQTLGSALKWPISRQASQWQLKVKSLKRQHQQRLCRFLVHLMWFPHQ
uniref:laminin subunit alpha-1-like n=1 Tax=Myxine glutinosa TaxID=7769 RepID=UPI00358F1135